MPLPPVSYLSETTSICLTLWLTARGKGKLRGKTKNKHNEIEKFLIYFQKKVLLSIMGGLFSSPRSLLPTEDSFLLIFYLWRFYEPWTIDTGY